MLTKISAGLSILFFVFIFLISIFGGQTMTENNEKLHKLLISDTVTTVECKLKNISTKHYPRLTTFGTIFLDCPFKTQPITLIFGVSDYDPQNFGKPLTISYLEKSNCLLSMEGPISPKLYFKEEYDKFMKRFRLNPKSSSRIHYTHCINIRAED